MVHRGVVLLGVSAVLALVGGAGTEREGSSILGLPAPRDPGRPGAVMLHGGGRVTDDALSRFIELAGGKQARVVIVPSAGYRRSDYASEVEYNAALRRRFGSWLRMASNGQVRSVEFLGTDNPDDSDSPAFVRPLLTATGVWFGGGAQSRLNYRYVGVYPRRTRFQEALREVVARGGIVGGTSAGMAAMPEIMAMYQGRGSPDGPVSLVAAHGLGLFDGAIVEQHFDGRGGRLERFTGLLRDSARLDRLTGRRGAGSRMLGLAVEGSTALVLQADSLETLGSANAHVFVKAPDDRRISWHTLKAGESAKLTRDAQGDVTLGQ